MPYAAAVKGAAGINYQAASLQTRAGASDSLADGYLLDRHGDPTTPIIEAYAGDRMRIHVVGAYDEQSQVFSLEGHEWPIEPGLSGTNLVGAQAVGGLQTFTVEPVGGAGGTARVAGDYLYGDDRGAYREAGMWGVLRVHPPGASVAGLEPLRASSGWNTWTVAGAAVISAVVAGAGARRWRRRAAAHRAVSAASPD
jgi:hypothetical protein